MTDTLYSDDSTPNPAANAQAQPKPKRPTPGKGDGRRMVPYIPELNLMDIRIPHPRNRAEVVGLQKHIATLHSLLPSHAALPI